MLPGIDIDLPGVALMFHFEARFLNDTLSILKHLLRIRVWNVVFELLASGLAASNLYRQLGAPGINNPDPDRSVLRRYKVGLL